jgi:hypothetical protein
MITILVCTLIGFVGGFFAGIKNANSSKLSKGKALLDALKGDK